MFILLKVEYVFSRNDDLKREIFHHWMAESSSGLTI